MMNYNQSRLSPREAASDALLDARRTCTPLDDFPGELPQTLAEAYAVQARSTQLWKDDLVGYKVGGIPLAHRDQYAENWLAGPVFSRQLYRVDANDHVEVSVFEGGFEAYEAEIIFTLTALSDHDVTAETAMSCVGRIHVGAEIASSPLGDINDIGPGAIISDFGNNAGVVLGPEVAMEKIETLFDTEVRVGIDGREVGRAKPQKGEAGPLGALAFLINRLRQEGVTDVNGLLVSSGAITGVHRSYPDTIGHIDFGPFGTFDITMRPRTPES